MSDGSPPYPLRDMLSHFISRSFNLLQTRLEEYSENNGPNIMRMLNTIYINAAKVLILFRFNKEFANSENITNYVRAYNAYNDYITRYITDLYRLYNIKMDQLKSPMYDVMGAIDIVVGHGYSRLPFRIFPYLLLPHFEGDTTKMIENLHLKLIAFFTSQNLPRGAKVDFKDGLAIVTLENNYRVSFSFVDFKKPPVCTDFEILLPNFVQGSEEITYAYKRNVYFVNPAVKMSVVNSVTEILSKTKKDAYAAVHRLLHSICLVFEFQKLTSEARKLSTVIGVALLPYDNVPNSCLRIIKVFGNRTSSFDIIRTTDSLSIFVNENRIGDAFGKSFDEIMSIMRRYYAQNFLSSLPFNKNEYTIDTSGDFPKLLYQGVAIYVDKWTGLFRVLNHPELDPYINNVNYLHKFTKKVKKLAEITTKNISFVEEW